MQEEERLAIEKFLDEIDCLKELKRWETGFNVFDVLKISRTEIRHSNVLAWLLNLNADHGVAISF